MEKYDYKAVVMEDVETYYNENADKYNGMDADTLREELYDDCFIADGVTGNASGSYTFNTWQAEENICHNLDLLGEALQEFGSDASYITDKGAEACDVTIRCYLLAECVAEFVDGLELEEDEEEEEDED